MLRAVEKLQEIPESLIVVTSESPEVLDGLGYYYMELKSWSLMEAFDVIVCMCERVIR